jgi:hypothetical protein
MIDREAVSRILGTYLEDPHWAEYYHGAPTGACRDYIALTFYYSDVEDEDQQNEAGLEIARLEGKFGLADWKHLLQYAGSSMFGFRCLEMIRKLGGLELP